MTEAKTKATEVRLPGLAWDRAEVHEGELHLALSAEAPHGWAAHFRALLARLGAAEERRWGHISVSRREIKVADVAEGGEGDLRHLLESALLQINTDFAPDGGGPEDEPSPQARRDARQTEAFRAFAEGG